jgi:hypothetical protein
MLLDLWERAHNSEYGIAITTDDRGLLRQHLYRVRGGSLKYENIVMVIPEKDDEIWLVHRNESRFRANNQGHAEPL